MQKRVIVTGGTGFIGRPLCEQLIERGYETVVLSRDPENVATIFEGKAIGARWSGSSPDGWAHFADGAQAIINLAGESIAEGRWTAGKMERILASRLQAGVAVLEAVRRAQRKPLVIIQASAIGYYGNRGEEPLDELSSKGTGFLSDVCAAWEGTTRELEASGARRLVIRTAPVLGPRGGFLGRIVPIMRRNMGGHLGSGRQWTSWIHLRDEVNAILFLLEREDLRGVFNLSSPNPVRNREFYRTLGAVLRKSASIGIPGFILRMAFGEVADELMLTSQRVVPRRLIDAGYEFWHPTLEGALREIL
jgi:uncharacterized protein (TIGR01777 family)